jgi:hypothetical protein
VVLNEKDIDTLKDENATKVLDKDKKGETHRRYLGISQQI